MARLLTLLERLLDAVAVVQFLAMFAIICVQIVLRYVFNAPLVWSDELAQYCFVWVAFIGVVLASRNRTNIAITAVRDRLPRLPATVLMLAAEGAMFGFALVLGWYGWRLMAQNADVTMTSMPFGYWIVYAIVPIAALFIALYAARDVVLILRSDTGRERAP